MRYEIPGYKTLTIENVVMDFNGTIAVDGVIKEAVKQRIIRLAEYYRVYVLTSDTQGTAARELADLPVTLEVCNTDHAGECKRRFVKGLGGNICACIGNGNNDVLIHNEHSPPGPRRARGEGGRPQMEIVLAGSPDSTGSMRPCE